MNRYMIVSAISPYLLQQAVEYEMTEGWRPEGGITFVMGDYLQVMVRENENVEATE